jgi:hypothetical protein
MSNAITVGKRLIPKEQIAFIEPFDPTANPDFQAGKSYRGRLVMVNPRESVLTEDAPQAFAEAHGFRMLKLDGVATNPDVRFRVENYVPGEGFKTTKPYATRLLWRDQDGSDQSKLLLSEPETVLAVVVRGRSDALADPQQDPARRPPRRKVMNAAGTQPEQ